MNKYADYIKLKLDSRTLYEQLSEECAELGKASLKMIRADKMSNNFTPITHEKAEMEFLEEVHDIMTVLCLLIGYDTVKSFANDADKYWKYRRWAERLEYQEIDNNEC